MNHLPGTISECDVQPTVVQTTRVGDPSEESLLVPSKSHLMVA